MEQTDLKEPLIQKKEWFNQGLLESYIASRDLKLQPPQLQEIPTGEDVPNEDEDIIKKKFNPPENEYMYEINKNWHDSDMNFYEQSTAQHQIFRQEPVFGNLNYQNPNVFCVISKSSNRFKSVDLKEYMGMEDYKRLTILRVRNYIALIKFLYRIYYKHSKQDEMFAQLRDRLFQVQPLLKHLNQSSYYENIFKKLKEGNVFIYTVVKKEEDQKSAFQDQEDEEIVDDNEELETFNFDEDYWNYFQNSYIQYGSGYTLDELSREETKWEVRVKWMESVLQAIRCDPALIKWVSWIQAKMNSLVDLDLKMDNGIKNKSESVLYLVDFLESQVKENKPEEEYDNDMKVFAEKQTVYPKFKIDTADLSLSTYAILKSTNVIREKLCLKIMTRERDTNYFLTVFEKKPLGNEKIYEKRINVRGKYFSTQEVVFHPQNQYLYIKFQLDYNTIQLVFNLKAKFKEPLLLDQSGDQYGFSDQYFFQGCGEHVIQYDLHNYSNIKIIKNSEVIQAETNKIQFSRIQDGFSFIGYKDAVLQEGQKPQTIYTFLIKGEEYTFDPMDKIVYDYYTQICVNYKGNAVLLLTIKENTVYTFTKFSIDPKSTTKYLKREGIINIQNKDHFQFEKDKMSVSVKSYNENFLILFSSSKIEKKVFVFNEGAILVRIDDCDNFDYIKPICNLTTGALESITVFDKYNGYETTENQLKYSIYKPELTQEKKLVWKSQHIQHSVYNNHVQACFPYVIFLYNHDQIYIKDLTKEGDNGYYFLNNFMQIDNKSRALTAHGVHYSGKFAINVTTINSNYTRENFIMKVHQLKTKYEFIDMHKLNGFLRFRVFAINQDMIQQYLFRWFSAFLDEKLNLAANIKCIAKSNAVIYEKWVGKKCTAKFIASWYTPPENPDKDLTQSKQEISHHLRSYWGFILYKDNEVSFYTNSMRYNFHYNSFRDLEPIWTVQTDETNEEIYDIQVDSFAKGEYNMYLIFSNATMKRYTAKLQYEKPISEFIEDQNIYSIESLYKKVGGGQASDKAGAGGVKKTDLWENPLFEVTIANRMVYGIEGALDLSFIRPNEKFQTGYITQAYNSGYPKAKYFISQNEAKVFYVSFESNEKCTLVIKPLLNTRQLPLFHNNRFIHPVVPLYDKRKGMVSVFTLNVNNYEYCQNYIQSHSRYKTMFYNQMKLMSPGIIIKFINGIERTLLLSDLGEEYIDIVRFNQSSDGKFIIIAGTRKGALPSNIIHDNINTSKDMNSGIFLYEFGNENMKLITCYLFAAKDFSRVIFDELQNKQYKKQLEEQKKLKTSPSYTVKNEVPGNEFNQYPNLLNYTNEGGYYFGYYNSEYDEYIDPKLYNKDLKEASLIDEYKKKALEYKETTRQSDHGYRSMNIFARHDSDILLQLDRLKENAQDDEAYKNIIEIENIKEKLYDFDIIYVVKESQVKQLEQYEQDLFEVKNDYRDNKAKQKKEIEEKKLEFDNHWYTLMYEARQQVDEQYRAECQEKEVDFDWNIYSNLCEQIDKENTAKKEEEEKIQFPNKEEDIGEFQEYKSEEINVIKKRHTNMNLSVNDLGYTLLVDRLKNILYFFYKVGDNFKLKRINFNFDFIIQGAVSSSKYLVVYSEQRYQIFDIENFDKNELPILDCIPNDEANLKGDKRIQDKYEWRIDDIKISHNQLILCLHDASNNFKYNLHYDIEKKINKLYVESTSTLISGDANYIWLLAKNQVYSRQTGISTFFIWPGGQISTPQHCDTEIFNINEDRTVMVSRSCLQLTFDYMSMVFDNELNNNGLDFNQKTSMMYMTKNMNYMFYKIGNNRSIFERIFKEDKDKLAIGEENEVVDPEAPPIEKEKLEEEQSNKASQQMKVLSYLLNYINESLTIGEANISKLGDFMLTYYRVKKAGESEDQPQEMNIFEKMFSLGRDKRPDLVEDILFHVVSCGNQNIHNIINSCFLQFLDTANSSQSFQEYLKNITKSTVKMKEVEKFQIESNDEGFVVDSHSSPVLDQEFQVKFRDMTYPKIDVDISYINMGNLLNEHGKDMMDTLSDSKYLSMMDIPFIQYIVMYQWRKVKSTIQKKLLLPFFCLLGFFFFYATFQIDWNRDNEEEIAVVVDPDTSNSTIIDEFVQNHRQVSASWVINVIGLSVILTYLFIMELKQLIKNPSDYVVDFWNMADIINYSLCTSVILMDAFNAEISTLRPTASVCVIILWIKMFYFLRVFETTSRLIRMIIEIVNDMKNFLIVLGIGIMGFANGFYILSQNQKDGIEPFAGSSFTQSVIYTYRLTLGDFATDAYNELYTIDIIIVWFIFLMATLFVVLVLLNLLIAIMGDTFGRVLENITNLTIREKVKLVAENEALFDRNEIFKDSQYLIIIKEKNLEALQSENWDGQINALKKQINDKLVTLESNFGGKLEESQQEFKRRFQDFDDKSKKLQVQSEGRVTLKLKEEGETIVNKMVEMFTSLNEKINTQNNMSAGNQEQMKSVLNRNSGRVDGIMSDLNDFKELVYKKLEIVPVINADSDEE